MTWRFLSQRQRKPERVPREPLAPAVRPVSMARHAHEITFRNLGQHSLHRQVVVDAYASAIFRRALAVIEVHKPVRQDLPTIVARSAAF